MDPINAETRIFSATVVDSGKVYSYQIGNFPVTSRRGVKYVFILYSYDANAILSEPLMIRGVKDILHEYTTYHDYLKDRGFRTKINYLDNKSSNALNKYNRNQGIYVQLVPPGAH